MKERNAVQRAFDEFGRGNGFERKSATLYRRTEEVIALSNLQKSQYGPRYYFNQCFWLRKLGDELYPKYVDCHIRLRLEDLLSAAEERINKLLDLAWDISDEKRLCELRALLKEGLMPLIERAESIAGLRTMLADGMLKGAGITGPAQQVLASTTEP